MRRRYAVHLNARCVVLYSHDALLYMLLQHGHTHRIVPLDNQLRPGRAAEVLKIGPEDLHGRGRSSQSRRRHGRGGPSASADVAGHSAGIGFIHQDSRAVSMAWCIKHTHPSLSAAEPALLTRLCIQSVSVGVEWGGSRRQRTDAQVRAHVKEDGPCEHMCA